MLAKRILLVEGPDDEHVVKAIFGRRGLQRIDEIRPHGGIQALLEALPVRIKESDIGFLGVLIDADADLSARWEQVRTHFIQSGYQDVPPSPIASGVILSAPVNSLLPRAGIWLMPNNTTAGILEDFLRFLVPSQSVLFQHAEQSVSQIPASEKRFSQVATPKALIHTWLAWQADPGKPLGLSITARFLEDGVPQVDIFVQWLRDLFQL